MGRGNGRGEAGVRLAAGRHGCEPRTSNWSTAANRSRSGRRRDPARHHVLGQHSVRDVARGHRRRASEAVAGHFVNAAGPTFVTRHQRVPLTPSAQADVREPVSSGCIATPFNADGAACQGGAVGTPFFLTTDGTSPRGLFANAYEPDAPVTGAATGVGTSQATVAGTVNPRGAAVEGVVPVRHDAPPTVRARPLSGSGRQRRRRRSPQTGRAARRDNDPLPGGRGERLRHLHGRR